jgi:creatinine amidohydrolase
MTAFGLASRQLELLRPREIRDRLAERSVVYLPLGTIEWHCEHLPVGLDALTAHGVSLRAAALDGGVVYPPLHYGTGGGHGGYPWTVMMPGAAEIEGLLRYTLEPLETLSVQPCRLVYRTLC